MNFLPCKVEADGAALEIAGGLRLPVPDARRELLKFEHEQAVSQSDFKTPYQAEARQLPLGETPLLLTRFQLRPGGFGVFDNEVADAMHDRCGPGRQGMSERAFAKTDGNKVEGALGGFRHGSSIPSARSISLSAINGNPISAVGSSPDRDSSRLMPRRSTLAAPAQSSGISRAT